LTKLPKKITQDFILEDYIKGIEVTAGVLSSQAQVLNLPILQLDSQNDFYDYEAKYTDGKTHFIIPALLTQQVENTIKSHALLMHQTLNCKGATRCDFIIRNDTPYFLEINTSPGMTALSDIPAEAKSIGIEFIKLCEIILKTAL
jgi:D-alanine-D-alanine ligase